MATRPAPPPASSIPRRLALLARLVVPVALCAGFVAGSCTLQADDFGLGTAAVAALIAAGIALVVGLLFLVITRDRRELRFFTVIGVYACIAAEFGAWWVFVWPAVIALLTITIGGIAAGRVARDAFRVGGHCAAKAGIISAVAITIAAAGVVAGFWLNLNIEGSGGVWCCSGGDGGLGTNINLFAFVPIAGGVRPLVSAIRARLAGLVCRRELAMPGSGRDAAGAGLR